MCSSVFIVLQLLCFFMHYLCCQAGLCVSSVSCVLFVCSVFLIWFSKRWRAFICLCYIYLLMLFSNFCALSSLGSQIGQPWHKNVRGLITSGEHLYPAVNSFKMQFELIVTFRVIMKWRTVYSATHTVHHNLPNSNSILKPIDTRVPPTSLKEFYFFQNCFWLLIQIFINSFTDIF